MSERVLTRANLAGTALELLQEDARAATRLSSRCRNCIATAGFPGFVHLYVGEEAVAVGVCSNLVNCRLGIQHASRPWSRPSERRPSQRRARRTLG